MATGVAFRRVGTSDSSRLEFRVLGPLEAVRDGEAVALGGAKQRALLAILLMQANRVVPTDELIESLWPDRAPGRPETAIQGYVSELRKALEPWHRPGAAFETLVTEANGYRIRAEPDSVDSDRFGRLLSEGTFALRRGRPQDASRLLATALALWRGPPLADFVNSPWAQAGRAKLEELRLSCIEERIDAELALGHHSDVISEVKRLISEEPLRERLRGQLMRALYGAGRQAEALKVYQTTRTTLLEDLGIDPSLELQALEVAILNQDPALTPVAKPPAPPTNLPAPPGALLGRDSELAALQQLLSRPDVRLVTVTGPGGIGKTRTAIEAAKQMQSRFPDGIWWVALQSVVDPNLVLSTAARIVGARDDLAAHIGNGRMLIVLDNLEQVTAVGPKIAALFTTCRNLTVLATSRESLHIEAEREYPLLSLSSMDAVTLFVERARAVRPDFSADGEVAQICQRLDGLPLAIELAAARVKALSARGILERLDLRLPLLTDGPRDLPERQRTLTATIAWSYDLLSENGRRLFRNLSIFAGGSTLEAAEVICEADLDTLTSLIDKSLLRREGERYLMLETIREYALGRLAATDGLERVSRRHANYYLVLAGRIDSRLGGSMSPNAHEQVDQERDNWRTAIRGALERGERRLALELVVALQQFWVKHGHLVEGLSWLNAALPLSDAPADSLLRAKALQLACEIDIRTGDLGQARIHCGSGLSLAREARDNNLIAWIHSDLAMLSHFDGVEDATAHFEHAHTFFANAGDTYAAASVLNNWANVEVFKGRLDRAVELVTEAIKLCRSCTDSGLLSATLHTSGTTQLMLGDPNSALAAMDEALRTSLLARDNGLTLECAEGIMWALAASERWEEAARVMGFAVEFRAKNGIRDWTSTAFGEHYVQSIRQALPARHLGEAMTRGRTMSPLDVVTLAHANSLIPL